MKKPTLGRENASKLERRFAGQELRVKRDDGAPTKLEGYAAVFNSDSCDLGGFIERLSPGCFSANLATNPDVRALINHDPNLVLGRTKAGTLRLKEDNIGLRFECDLPDTQAARDLSVLIDRGDVSQSSFAMTVDNCDWTELAGGKWTRTIKQASLYDTSCVVYPAYEASSCSVRSLFPNGVPDSITTLLRTSECMCECDECEAGNCLDCSDPECDDPNCDCAERNLNRDVETALLRARVAQAL